MQSRHEDYPIAEPVAPNRHGLWTLVAPLLALALGGLLVMYLIPDVKQRWGLREASVDAEAVYLKRKAELRAESEQAVDLLKDLDQRVQLVSLGFRTTVRKVVPTVVHLTNERKEVSYRTAGTGSGVIVKPNVILTNHHVVKSADRVMVTFPSGRKHLVDAKHLRLDDASDLAILILPPETPEAVQDEMKIVSEFADSDRDIQVGDWTLAIGSPLGLRQTVSQGILSATGRRLRSMDLVKLLQTDAAIHPGNSGGPLYDLVGRIVGINVAIASDNGSNQGIGFAIPSNVVKKNIEELYEFGEVRRGFLGIVLRDLSDEEREGLGGERHSGAVFISAVQPDSPASHAELLPGDVVLLVNEQKLDRYDSTFHFRQLIADFAPGAEISFRVLRTGNALEKRATVGKRPVDLKR